jgi:copper chaperone CopZ
MKVLGKKTAVWYLVVLSLTAMACGFALDKFFEILKINPINMVVHIHNHEGYISDTLKLVLGFVFLALIISSLYRRFISSKIKSKEKKLEQQTIKIEGMSCNHCVMNVKKAISGVNGVTDVDVNLAQGEAYVKGVFDLHTIESAVHEVGYEVVSH